MFFSLIVLSLLLLILTGVGAALFVGLGRLRVTGKSHGLPKDGALVMGLLVVAGLHLFHALVFMLRDFRFVLAVLAVLALLGGARAVRVRGRELVRGLLELPRWGPWWIWFALIALIPISDWDARSSWFFQGQVQASLGGLFAQPWWREGEYWFPQWDYPKLFSSLNGFLMWALRDWNDFHPKIALLVFWFLTGLGLHRAHRETWSWAWLFMLVVFSFHRYLWNGYMDGYLAVFFGLALLFFVRADEGAEGEESERATGDRLLAWAYLSLLPLLKNEGLVLCALGALVGLWRFRKWPWRAPDFPVAVLLMGSTALNWGLWTVWKKTEGLSSWLSKGGGQFWQRWEDGQVTMILQRLLWDGLILRGWLLVLLALLIGLVCSQRLRTGFWKEGGRFLIPILVSLPYIAVLTAVYASTPLDLDHQMSVSQDRVSYPVRMAGFVSFFLLVEWMLRVFNSVSRARASLGKQGSQGPVPET